MDDFEIRKCLGVGSFGKVYLVRKRDSGEYYAMKSLKKEVIIENDQVEATQLEKKIMQGKDHPFIVPLHFVFQTSSQIYFVMQFIRGGELYQLQASKKRFEECQAKFYVAQLAHVIGHLHSKEVIYRDLKPENVLVGEDGYLFLADFGLCKDMSDIQFA